MFPDKHICFRKFKFSNSKSHFATAMKMSFLSAFSYTHIICNYYLGQLYSPFLKGLANAIGLSTYYDRVNKIAICATWSTIKQCLGTISKHSSENIF